MYELLNNRSVIKIYGENAKNFLQNLITNDINYTDKSPIYTYMLTSNGRYNFDFFIVQQDHNSFLIDIAKIDTDLFINTLLIYRLRTNLEVIDCSDQYGILYSLIKPTIKSVCTYQDPRHCNLGWRTIISITKLNNKINWIDNLYLSAKYTLSIPDGENDLLRNTSIVMEYGAEELNAISYNKGCYLGQELITRTKNNGIIRKKLFQLIGCNMLQSPLLDLTLYDKFNNKVGYICSVWNNYGIAILNIEKLETNKVVFYQQHKLKTKIPIWRKSR